MIESVLVKLNVYRQNIVGLLTRKIIDRLLAKFSR